MSARVEIPARARRIALLRATADAIAVGDDARALERVRKYVLLLPWLHLNAKIAAEIREAARSEREEAVLGELVGAFELGLGYHMPSSRDAQLTALRILRPIHHWLHRDWIGRWRFAS